MSRRALQIAAGVVVMAAGVALVFSPHAVAAALGRPSATSSQMINLRATWGGTVLGLGAFLVWLEGVRPWKRAAVGLAMWAVLGIGVARAVGFALDGRPDARQWVWLGAEVVIVAACALGLRAMRR